MSSLSSPCVSQAPGHSPLFSPLQTHKKSSVNELARIHEAPLFRLYLSLLPAHEHSLLSVKGSPTQPQTRKPKLYPSHHPAHKNGRRPWRATSNHSEHHPGTPTTSTHPQSIPSRTKTPGGPSSSIPQHAPSHSREVAPTNM